MSYKPKLNLDALKAAIEIAGGIKNLSEKTEVSYQSIIDWKNGRRSPSVESCIKIEKAVEGKVTRQEILPDFPWNETKTVEKKDDKLEAAKKLLASGIDTQTISKATGIPIEEIEKLEEKKDEKLEIVKKMLERGMDKAAIVDITGLSIEEVEKLED